MAYMQLFAQADSCYETVLDPVSNIKVRQEAEWYRSIKSNGESIWTYLPRLSKDDQLKFALNQTFAVVYFAAMYGAVTIPFIKELAADLKNWFKLNLQSHDFENTSYNNMRDLTAQLLDLGVNYSGVWPMVNIAELQMFWQMMEDNVAGAKKFPLALHQTTVLPFVIFMNNQVPLEFTSWNKRVTIAQVKYLGDEWRSLDAPQSIDDRILIVWENYVGNSYEKQELADRIGIWRRGAPAKDPKEQTFRKCVMDLGFYMENPNARMRSLDTFDICRFLAGVKMSGEFEEVLYRMAGQLPHEDLSRPGLTNNFRLFYAVHATLNDLFNADFLFEEAHFSFRSLSNVPDNFRTECTRKLFALLCYLNITQGIRFKNMSLFNRFFSTLNEVKTKQPEIAKVLEYVQAHHDGEVASAESLSAWEKSVFAGCEAIDLISQQRSIVQKDRTELTATDLNGSTEEDLTTDLPDIEFLEPSMEADDTAEKEESDDDTTTDGDGTTTEEKGDDQGDSNQNDSEGDGNSQSSGEDTGGGSGEDNSASGDAAGSSSTSSNTQSGADVEPVEASDANGIPFHVNPEGNETVESVLIREELEEFISDVLTNPPKTLSPQAVSALTNLQKYWIHLLGVETIMGILGRLVALPEKFKNLQYSENQKHE